MQKLILVVLMSLSVCLVDSTASAADTKGDILPPAVAIVPWVQVPGPEVSVSSRFSWIYGRHQNVFGVDIGLVGNVTDKVFGGVALSGIFNETSGEAYTPLQIAGIVNNNSGSTYVVGVQAAGGMNINSGSGFVGGLQLAALGNIAPKSRIYGMQVGLYNRADRVYGFQIGLINHANVLRGIQIGLMNINHDGLIPYFPVINIGI